MRWFKHISAMHDDESIVDFLNEYKADGYGIWMLIVEKVSLAMHKKSPDLCSYECSLQSWARHCRVTKSRFAKISSVLEQKGLIKIETKNNSLRVSIEVLKTLRDEYTDRPIRTAGYKAKLKKSVGTLSGECRESVGAVDTEAETDTEYTPPSPLPGECSDPVVEERIALKEEGFGEYDAKDDGINVLKYQKKVGVTDQAIMDLIAPYCGDGPMGWRLKDGMFPRGKYGSRTMKGMMMALMRDEDYTFEELRTVLKEAAKPESFSNRKWSYIFRPAVAEGLLADSKRVNGAKTETLEEKIARQDREFEEQLAADKRLFGGGS